MTDTPETDKVLRIEHNFGAYPGDSGDGVTPQEAYDEMVSSLARLCRRFERELSAYQKAERSINEALNMGDGTYRP